MQEIDLSGIKIVTFCNVEKNKMRSTRLHDKQYNQNLFRSAISGKVTEKKLYQVLGQLVMNHIYISGCTVY